MAQELLCWWVLGFVKNMTFSAYKQFHNNNPPISSSQSDDDLKRPLRLTKLNTVNKNGSHICHNTNLSQKSKKKKEENT